MIQVQFKDSNIQELVLKAVIRSVSTDQIWPPQNLPPEVVADLKPTIFIGDRCPSDYHFQKIVVFGPKPDVRGDRTVLATLTLDPDSPVIRYAEHRLTQSFKLRERHFERYDFAREWNNLGYGRIEPAPGSPWGVAQTALVGDPFAIVWDETQRSVLWYNRAVGPIDGFDWRMIEDFISDYRCRGAESLATYPVLSEIPADYAGAVTFRIDCDENIASGRELFELYRDRGLPFSLAVKTDQEMRPEAIALMREVVESGGSVVSHSHTHAPNWGDNSKWEAETSRRVLEGALQDPRRQIRYAVSPFHQNPRGAVEGIYAGGIEAFVGGILCNDPEYLMARSGVVPFVPGIISHSQQCMFHGDCFHQEGERIDTWELALENALATETFFGYLDHPFSTYQYGWKCESERLTVHGMFLNHLATKPGVWFASLTDCLDFLWDRAQMKVSAINGVFRHSRQSGRSSKHIAVRWNGNKIKLL